MCLKGYFVSQIFISYKREDRSASFVKVLKQKLEDSGFDVWVDTDLLRGGQYWQEEIDKAIRASIALLVVMTPKAHTSLYITYEWSFAIGRGMRVIPLMFEETTEVHPRLDVLQFRDFTNHYDTDWQQLIDDLIEIDTGVSSKSREVPPFVKRAIDAFDSYDEEDRRTAINNLTKSNHPAAIEALAKGTMHHLDDVRTYASRKLATKTNYSDIRVVDGLIEGIKFKISDPKYRISSLEMLAKVGTRESIQFLIEFYHYKPMHDMPGNYKPHPDEITTALQFINKDFAEDVEDILIEALNSSNQNIRKGAILALGNIGKSTYLDYLIPIAKETEIKITQRGFSYWKQTPKQLAITMLSSYKSPKSISALLEIIEADNRDDLKIDAINALNDIGNKESLLNLIPMLEHDNPNIRATALNGLSNIQDDEVVDQIITLLSDDTTVEQHYRISMNTVAQHAVNALKAIDTPRARDAVNDWEEKEDLRVQDIIKQYAKDDESTT